MVRRKEDRHGFTLVFTAWRHGDAKTGECGEAEMTCPTSDGGAHRWQTFLEKFKQTGIFFSLVKFSGEIFLDRKRLREMLNI